jgi:hypothetical protein
MVEQLEQAPEDVGFVYPNPQHFGNRHDYFEAPAYNLHLLLSDNYCAATSLFDRRVFDAGVRYPEDVVFGHEDWDLVLQMAERGICGVPADGPTFLYRKQGFSRVNAVEYGPETFHQRIERRHPLLYEARDRIKGWWAPALSLVLLDDFDGTDAPWPDDTLDGLARQSTRDFEVICAASIDGNAGGRCVSVVQEDDRLARLAAAVAAARGRFVVLVGPSAAGALRQRMFAGLLGTVHFHNPRLSRLVLGHVADWRGAPFALLGEQEVARATPCAVAWRRDPERESDAIEVGAGRSLLDDMVLAWELEGPLQWRAL